MSQIRRLTSSIYTSSENFIMQLQTDSNFKKLLVIMIKDFKAAQSVSTTNDVKLKEIDRRVKTRYHTYMTIVRPMIVF